MTDAKVADGDLAAVVTFLEMRESPRVEAPVSELILRRIEHPHPAQYRELFRKVGSRWLWFSRLVMDDSSLTAIIGDPNVELFTVMDGGHARTRLPRGRRMRAFVRRPSSRTIRPRPRWLLAEAISRAWRDGIRRVHVHTCTLDHPAALQAYRRAGFTPYRREVERFPDPRLIGALPKDCAPQIPLIG